MRKIIATAHVSLDGVMQGPGATQEDTSGGFDLGGWTTKYSTEKSGAAVLDMVGTLANPYDLLLGRKTYDIFASYWPNVPADNRIGSVFTKANKTLYPQLLEANLIDRLLLMTCPIVLGKGKRLFGNTSHQVALKLMKSEVTSTGIIIATYEPTPGGK